MLEPNTRVRFVYSLGGGRREGEMLQGGMYFSFPWVGIKNIFISLFTQNVPFQQAILILFLALSRRLSSSVAVKSCTSLRDANSPQAHSWHCCWIKSQHIFISFWKTKVLKWEFLLYKEPLVSLKEVRHCSFLWVVVCIKQSYVICSRGEFSISVFHTHLHTHPAQQMNAHTHACAHISEWRGCYSYF